MRISCRYRSLLSQCLAGSLLILSAFLFHSSAFSDEACSVFRETIGKYGHTDKDDVHSYLEPYKELLSPFKDSPCNVLEIGVNFGGSAILWYDYLPQSHLFLLDNRDVMLPLIASAMDPKRWQLYVADAYTPEVVALLQQECPEGFDVIIDDGPHTLESQIFILSSYLPLLKSGGVLIIEDIQGPDSLEVLKEFMHDTIEFEMKIIDLRPIKGRYDDILFVIKKF